MAKVEIKLPAMGEGIIEATITRWLVEVGAQIEEDDPIVEVATDKVDSEIPAPQSGKLIKQLLNEGDIPKVGQTLAIIETAGDNADTDDLIASDKEILNEEWSENIKSDHQESTIEHPEDIQTERFLSPLVRSIAKKENISAKQIDAIKGTGLNNRITKEDILKFIHQNPHSSTTQEATTSKTIGTSIPTSKIYGSGSHEIIEMDRMRKLIADHMVMSKQVSPHVTSFTEVDVTNMVKWRDKMKNKFFEREKEKLTFTPLFVEAVTKAIKDFPLINISVDGNKIVRKDDINIGMAAALPSGNLIVPVIKHADKFSLSGLATKVNDLADRARNNKLLPDEIQGGTFTITNVGTFGNTSGTPIINQPEVAILAVGAIKKKPAVIETDEGDVIAIRHIMILAMSYDHRVVDGALGGMFLQRVADYLEKFDKNREI